MVKDNVLRPLGIPHLPLARTLENDGQLGVPIMGWGSYPNVVEAAKIGRLLHDEGLSGLGAVAEFYQNACPRSGQR